MKKATIKYSITAAVFAVIAIVVVVLVRRPRPDNGDGEPPEVPVNVVVSVVERGIMPDAILLPASVEAFKSVTVSAEVAGKVEWIGIEEGQAVKTGAEVARIDTRTLAAEHDQALSSYNLAKTDFARNEKLLAENAVSKDAYDQSKSRLEVAKAALELASIRLEKGAITAPVAGILNRRYIELGEYVNVGDPVCDIVQVDKVKVVVDVPEKDITYVSVGKPLAILTDTMPGQRDTAAALPAGYREAARFLPEGMKVDLGTVTYRSVVAEADARTYRVEVTVGNDDRALLPGRIVRVFLLRRLLTDAISVPLTAVIPREGRTIVFVENGGRAEEVEVSLGITDGRNIQVTSGLDPGERLIIDGQRQLRNGQAVAVQDPPA